MTELKKCRNCQHWVYVGEWRGLCDKHIWKKPRWSESAESYGCPAYEDKQRVYTGKVLDLLVMEYGNGMTQNVERLRLASRFRDSQPPSENAKV